MAKHLNKKTICIDFDGVLAHYDGWKGEDHLGEPIEGMKELIHSLRFDHNYTIIIYSCRSFVKIDKWCKWSWEMRNKIKYKELVEQQDKYKIKVYG